jgi:basic membrane lipoprotein Med (substrate-binding protein (PBP1-ABC) superfamily)
MPWLSIASILGVLLAGLVAAPSAAEAQTKHKFAMIMPGPIQDADYNALGYVAVQEVAKAYGIEVAHSESVAVADAERVSREYINAGFDIIAYHGGQYPTIMSKLASQFPKVAFIQEASGRMTDPPKNAWVIGRKYYQGFYVLGTLAALATKANKVGYVGGVRIPDVISSTNAVHQALKDHNPKASLVYNYIGDFSDPVKGRQTAEAQIASGADFLVTFVNLGIYGVAEAAKAAPKQPVLMNTLYTNKWDSAPQNLAVSLLFDFAKPYKEIVGHIIKGELAGCYEMRPGSGIDLGEIRHVSADIQNKVRAVFQEVADGKKSLPEVTNKTP